MRVCLLALMAVLALGACERAANDFPPRAQAMFHRSCPASDPVCACTWDKITRAMTAEQYNEALTRFRAEGLMDPRITQARTACLDRAR